MGCCLSDEEYMKKVIWLHGLVSCKKAEPVRSTFLYSRFYFRIRCIFCVAALRGDARNEEKKN